MLSVGIDQLFYQLSIKSEAKANSIPENSFVLKGLKQFIWNLVQTSFPQNQKTVINTKN